MHAAQFRGNWSINFPLRSAYTSHLAPVCRKELRGVLVDSFQGVGFAPKAQEMADFMQTLKDFARTRKVTSQSFRTLPDQHKSAYTLSHEVFLGGLNETAVLGGCASSPSGPV